MQINKHNKTITKIFFLIFFSFTTSLALGQHYPKNRAEDKDGILTDKYWSYWEAVMPQIDADIEKHRKANVEVKLDDVAPNSEIKVTQLTSDFKFGAPIFYYNRAGTPDRNEAYRNLWGTLFNQATVGIYWKFFELREGKPRFKSQMWDSQEFLNTVEAPTLLPTAFVPALDEIVEFLYRRNVSIHAHSLVWGNRRWHFPEWIFHNYAPSNVKSTIKKWGGRNFISNNYTPTYVASKQYQNLSQADADEIFGTYADKIQQLQEKRISQLALQYGDKFSSWDVVNESGTDYFEGSLNQTGKVCVSKKYGIMPQDYTFKAFKHAEKVLPKNAKLVINEWNFKAYAKQIKELLSRGVKIDQIGLQRHLWNTNDMKPIMAGNPAKSYGDWSVEGQRNFYKTLEEFNIPIHISEVTIIPPEFTSKGNKAQATIARNYYKFCFSIKNIEAISYWRTLDRDAKFVRNLDEPYAVGVFTYDCLKKPIYHALDDLFNKEWKTNLRIKAPQDRILKFRGFKGDYKIEYTDSLGNIRTKNIGVR